MKKIASVIGISVISMAVALAPAFAQVKSQEPAGTTAAVQPKAGDKAMVPGSTAKDEKKPTANEGTETRTMTIPGKPAPDMKSDSKAVPAKPGTDVKSENVPPKTGMDTKASAVPVKPAPDMKSDGKAVPAKPGTDTRSQNVPAKMGINTLAVNDTAKPAPDMKNDGKAAPAKTGIDTRNENVPAKTGTDTKSGSLSGKQESGAKAEKAAPAKPGADVKNEKAVTGKVVKDKAADTKSSAKHVRHAKPSKASGKIASHGKIKSHHQVKSKDADRKAITESPMKPSTGN